jgi:hypothetical protein
MGSELIGLRFGKLLVIRESNQPRKKNRSYRWECQCDCGVIKEICGHDLLRRATRSCGCAKSLNLAGQRFGKLIALRPTNLRMAGNVLWQCACDCGATKLTTAVSLKHGWTRSCGCLAHDRKGKSEPQRWHGPTCPKCGAIRKRRKPKAHKVTGTWVCSKCRAAAIKASGRKRTEIANLTDGYIRALIGRDGCYEGPHGARKRIAPNLPARLIPQELVEVKRFHLLIKRHTKGIT